MKLHLSENSEKYFIDYIDLTIYFSFFYSSCILIEKSNIPSWDELSSYYSKYYSKIDWYDWISFKGYILRVIVKFPMINYIVSLSILMVVVWFMF